MQLLEYQAKKLLKNAGVAVPHGIVASDTTDVNIDQLSFPVVIKSQVPIGGRGKLGGVKIVKSADDFSATFSEVKTLGIKGYTPDTLLVEEALSIADG